VCLGVLLFCGIFVEYQKKRSTPKHTRKISHPHRTQGQQSPKWWANNISQCNFWHPFEERPAIKTPPTLVRNVNVCVWIGRYRNETAVIAQWYPVSRNKNRLCKNNIAFSAYILFYTGQENSLVQSGQAPNRQ